MLFGAMIKNIKKKFKILCENFINFVFVNFSIDFIRKTKFDNFSIRK